MAGAVRWSAFAVIGKQASQMVFAVALAVILGPDQYGILSAASVYVTLTTLILDQGLASALIQRPQLAPRAPGAVATVNLGFGAVLALATWFAAPQVADFFDTPEMTNLVRVLGAGLLLKALAINPRAMLMRQLRFGIISIADVAGGVIGAAAGLTAGLLGAGTWSLAWQVLVTDAVIAIVFIATRQGGRPNFDMRYFIELLPFSIQIFLTAVLAFVARNIDNILVGRYLGVDQLSLYAVAYRVLSVPVQLVGQTINRVAFPTMSRMAADGEDLAPPVLKMSEMLAIAAVPPMVFVAVASHEVVEVVLGSKWRGAIPVLAILALAGARETMLLVSHSLMRALGRGRLIVKYEIGAAAVQLIGIAIGLQWGIVGVASGFLIAGVLLSPILLVIQHRLAHVTWAQQAAAVGPTLHASAWAALAYWLVRLIGLEDLPTMLLGWLAFMVVGLGVLRVFHHRAWLRLIRVGPLKVKRKPDSKVTGAAA